MERTWQLLTVTVKIDKQAEDLVKKTVSYVSTRTAADLAKNGATAAVSDKIAPKPKKDSSVKEKKEKPLEVPRFY